MSSNYNAILNATPVEYKEDGRIYIGSVEVEMNRMFIFGSQQKLHEMISFFPGMGNGCYEVYGEIKHVPGHGFRMVKVEIELVSPQEMKHLEREHADHVLEVSY